MVALTEKLNLMALGYAFTVIGKDEPWFFANGKNDALAHFRHHYFQMGLIAHFHKAGLLVLWEKLAKEVEILHTSQSQASLKKVRHILENLLRFTNSYWFSELSDLSQAKELFNSWKHHLGIQSLLDRLLKEAQDVHKYLEMMEQKRQTDTTVELLTVVAIIGLVYLVSL
ncbi:MAG: hypothetical protein DRR19_33115 [Candidatus Parabeggiatoa sp. nov. 1]|nr:MAG: hypothetical protein DRR19_33115 [Gammaproteobacteria bacterium]